MPIELVKCGACNKKQKLTCGNCGITKLWFSADKYNHLSKQYKGLDKAYKELLRQFKKKVEPTKKQIKLLKEVIRREMIEDIKKMIEEFFSEDSDRAVAWDSETNEFLNKNEKMLDRYAEKWRDELKQKLKSLSKNNAKGKI